MVDVLTSLRKAGVPIGTIIDVGVNSSTPTLINAFPTHKHILIEPISDYFDTIHRNYRGMNYHLVEAAANDKDGKVYIESAAKYGDGKISHSHIVDGPGPNRREVPSLKVDTILAGMSGLGQNFLLKVDIEGFRVTEAILDGAADTMKHSSIVMIEMTAPEMCEQMGLMGKAGFQLFELEDICYYDGVLWQMDGIFVRKDIIAANPALKPMSTPPFNPKLWQPMRKPFFERVSRRLKLEIRRMTAR